jgi:hypothetical protein
MNKKIFFTIGLIILGALIGLVLAENYQNEFSQLEQELIDSGYRWLVDYSGDDLYPKVEVYEKDGNEVLAVFNLTRYNESAFNEYKIFLTALGEGYSQDVFDLRSVCGSASIEGNLSGGDEASGLCGVEYDWVVDPEIIAGNEDGLVGLWHFNNDWTDSSGNGNHGTAFGDATFGDGILGTAGGEFDGDGDYVSVGSINYSSKTYWSKGNDGVWKFIANNGTHTFVNGVLACPEGMAYIDKLGGYCIDRYEASTPGCEIVGNNCGNYTHASYCPTICIPESGVLGSVGSNTGTTAVAYSRENVAPLVGVSQMQARQMCTNAGKHLCTDEEWLGAANIWGQVYYLPSDLAVAPYRCVTGSSAYCNYAGNSNYACNTSKYSGGISGCVSAEGVYDMVGNVWEWTNETVGYTKPCGDPAVGGACYINATSGDWQTSSISPLYGNDYVYFSANTVTNKAVLRGGYWSNGATAGPFCAYLSNAPSTVSYLIGFRCCSGVLG